MPDYTPPVLGVQQAIVNAWRQAGANDAAIAGVLANIKEESGMNPTLRHADQPKYGGEAHFAHGLYQEGGAEWNKYANWLQQNHPNAKWQDPALQSQFAAENLRDNYPAVWAGMNHQSPTGAAQLYASGYLKPAAQYLASRNQKFASQGVPGIDAYPLPAIGGNAAAVAGGGQETAPTVPQSPTRIAGPTPPQTSIEGGTPVPDQPPPQQPQGGLMGQAQQPMPQMEQQGVLQMPQIPYYMRRTNPQLAYSRIPLPPGFKGFQGA